LRLQGAQLLTAAEGKQVLALIDANPELQNEPNPLTQGEPAPLASSTQEQPITRDEPLTPLRDYQV
jgi:hypothetical protein